MLFESTFAVADGGLDGGDTASPDRDDEQRQRPAVAAPAEMGRRLATEIPFLRRMVRRWHRDAADAEDLVQDTIMRALASAHQWQPGSSLHAWLLPIMRNQFLATQARSQRARVAAEMIEFESRGAGADADVRLTLRDVERAFHRLPEKQRAALLLAGIEGKSYSEAATTMGTTPDAVRCHLSRARDRLRSAVYRRDDTSWLRPVTAPPRRSAEAVVQRQPELV